MRYTVAAVSPEVRSYETKYGVMNGYKVRFQETDTQVVEISQKQSTPAPTVGQTMDGTIDMSGAYGPKFKKEYNQGGNFSGGTPSGSQPSSTGSGFGTSQSGSSQSRDNFTMYLSYAKDIAVALTATKNGFSSEEFELILDRVAQGGETLYKAHNDPTSDESAETPKAKDNLPNDSDINDMLDDSEPIDLKDVPF